MIAWLDRLADARVDSALASDTDEPCDVAWMDGRPACSKSATVELILTFPCGGNQRRLSCGRHHAWIDRGLMTHREHPEDLDDRATVVVVEPIRRLM